MIKAVLFDYGGVLSYGGKDFRGFLRALLQTDQLHSETESLIIDLGTGKLSAQEFTDHLNRGYNTKVNVEQLVSTDSFPRNEKVYVLAGRLREQGIKTGILSNTSDLNAQRLEEGGFYAGFEPIVLSCREGSAKPEPAIYQLAAQRLRLPPEAILFIDDQERFLAPARELGFHIIKADSEEQIVRDTMTLINNQNGTSL